MYSSNENIYEQKEAFLHLSMYIDSFLQWQSKDQSKSEKVGGQCVILFFSIFRLVSDNLRNKPEATYPTRPVVSSKKFFLETRDDGRIIITSRKLP